MKRAAEFRARNMTTENMLDAIIESRREIIKSVNRNSGNRVQFNTGDRDTVMRTTEVMSDQLACLVFRNTGGFEMQQSQFMEAAGEVMVNEIKEMRAEIKRLNDIYATQERARNPEDTV